MRLPLRVAVVGTNDPKNYSGGRYHGLLLAYAAAAGGAESHVVTDHVPGFAADCEPLAPGKVAFHRSADFASGLPEGRFDWVVVVPTGVFLPDFYENCLDFAARAGARVALVNFESANWFNALAPEPKDPRLWDYWRRTVMKGGLVLSSARESHRFARTFYAAEAGASLRFEVWSPPVNSRAAMRFDGMPKDGSILAFVRPQDRHKGSIDLAAIDATLFRDRTLRLVAGRDVTPEFRAAIGEHLGKAPGSRLEILTRISDLQKFRLTTAAQTVLFPSRFEGFGYPPVEAAFAGTESVCFDLPVLRETVGGVAHFAPVDDMAAFGRALAAALERPERRADLRRAVHRFADFDCASAQLVDILLRGAEVVRPVPARRHRAAIGPFARTAPRAAAEVDRGAPPPPLPPSLRAAGIATSGDALFSATLFVSEAPDRVEARNPGGPPLVASWAATPAPRNFVRLDVGIAAPGGILRRRVLVEAFAGSRRLGDSLEFQVDALEGAAKDHPVRFGISGDAAQGDVRRIRAWVLARRPVTAIRIGNGARWWTAAISTDRSDVLAKHPTYATARCQFVLELPSGTKLDADTRVMAMNGDDLVDTLKGWPPAPSSFYAADVALGTETPKLAAPASPPAAAPAATPKPPHAPERKAGPVPIALPLVADALDIVNVNDTRWHNGVSRTGGIDRLGAVLLRGDDRTAVLVAGMVARGASGGARTVTGTTAEGNGVVLLLDGPLNPYVDGFPQRLQVFEGAAAPDTTEPPSFVLNDWTDTRWWHGVWNNRDERWRCGFFLRADQARAMGIGVGARLRFAGSGPRRVEAVVVEGRDVRIWLDGRIKPQTDGAPHQVRVMGRAPSSPENAVPLLAGKQNRAWRTGVFAGNDASQRHGTRVRLPRDAAVSRGTPLRFPSGRVARVVSADPMPDAIEATLDCALDVDADGFPGAATRLDEAEASQRSQVPWLYPDAGYAAKDPLHVQLVDQARRTGRVVLAPSDKPRTDRPRILFLTLVPPAPANQGNRVVTRNFIQHLVDLGFDVDVLLQGWIDAFDATRVFPDHVRILALPFPNWPDCDAVRRRRQIKDIAETLRPATLDAAVADALARESRHYHPYFIVRDAVVEVARTLATTHRYASVVVNYTHMLRVTAELARFVELPPVCVITHDALSRLPTTFEGQPLDTMYRACTPQMERDALDAAPAVVMAISESEAAYFRALGVKNPVVLTEYDALDETRPFTVPDTGFAARTLVFHGSANPMNIAGLNWFVDECWSDILRAVKNARLVICGRVGDTWKTKLPNVEVIGETSREAMFGLCNRASIAINPCVAGTGLKIKTVEAACLGLPSVCLPLAVEGLEAVADRFAIVADSGESFARGCVALLTEERRWRELRASALQFAEERFSQGAVYGAIDAAMGWREGIEARRAARSDDFPQVGALAPGAEPTLAAVDEPFGTLRLKADDPAALLAVGAHLARAGQVETGRRLVERVAVGRPGDPHVAALAARLALDTGDPWLAAVHGAVVIGQRPLETEGYHLVGAGLRGAGQTAASVECLIQGLLVAPHHEGLLDELDQALVALKRTDEAERWRGRRSATCPIGEYVGLDAFRVGPRGLRGWTAGPDGLLEASRRRAEMRFILPEGARDLAFTLDFAVERNGNAPGSPPVALFANGQPFEISVAGEGAPIQTVRGLLPTGSFGPDRCLTFTLDFGPHPGERPKLKPIGLMLTEA